MGGAKGYGDMTGQRFGRWTVLGMTTSCACARPVPSGRKPKAEKTVTQSDPVGDDWMFGEMGARGLFARRR